MENEMTGANLLIIRDVMESTFGSESEDEIGGPSRENFHSTASSGGNLCAIVFSSFPYETKAAHRTGQFIIHGGRGNRSSDATGHATRGDRSGAAYGVASRSWGLMRR